MAKVRKIKVKFNPEDFTTQELLFFTETANGMHDLLMSRGDAVMAAVHTKNLDPEVGTKKTAILQKFMDEYSGIMNVCEEELGNRMKRKTKITRSPREIANIWDRWGQECEFLSKTHAQMQNEMDKYNASQVQRAKDEDDPTEPLKGQIMGNKTEE